MKKNGSWKKKILYSVTAAVLFVLLLVLFFPGDREYQRIPYDVVFLGDSVYGLCRDETSIAAKLQEKTGLKCYNGGLGGTVLGRADAERRLGYTKDSISAAGLVRSFVVKDFGVQRTVHIREAATDYFEDTLGDLGQIDFDQVKILFIGSGLNDYHSGTPIESTADPYDEYTYCGAIRSIVKELREAYPELRIIFITPPYTWYTDPELTCEEYDLGGGVLEDYVNAEIGLCEALNVEVIDIYHDYYPHDTWDDLYLYTDDGLSSMYFDQNMITSGRWFLSVACGFSSYFTIPWIIGLIGLLWLALTAVALTELLELADPLVIMAVSGLLVSFPALASTFAYVFTMDGYMMALFLAILAVLFTKKQKKGWLAGAVCLAFSMGIYQAYLPFAILLCVYVILLFFMEEKGWKTKAFYVLRYLGMGVAGAALYYVILQILLKLQGKVLDTYQGINSMEQGGSGLGLFATIRGMYVDFLAFTVHGNVLVNNIFSFTACAALVLLVAYLMVRSMLRRKWWKNPAFFVIIILLAAGLPLLTNVILVISPNLTYHLLMRYQWVLYLILMLAFVDRYASEDGKTDIGIQWVALLAAGILVFNYGVSDNIGYSNLEKKYEKTYAYCVRLLDRIEQTEGYYQGIPIALVGVIGYDEFPTTDITGKVTDGMIGLSGDYLIYKGADYQAFMQNYLGATLNFLDPDTVGEIYMTQEYIDMDTFPGANSTRVVDGILYVKTENCGRD